MIGTIIGAIVVGLIVGALARLIMPGKQNIGVIMTILLGALGSLHRNMADVSARLLQLERRVRVHPVHRGRRRRHHLDRVVCRDHR